MLSLSKILPVVAFVVLTSCSNSEQEIQALRDANKSLIISEAIISNSNTSIYKDFQKKLTDPLTAERARIWSAKADSIAAISIELRSYIEQLKKTLVSKTSLKNGKPGEFDERNTSEVEILFTKEGKELHNKLKAFKSKCFKLDEGLLETFQNTLPAPYGILKDSSTEYAVDNSIFYKASALSAITRLSSLQNKISASENILVIFCNYKVGYVDDFYTEFCAFAGTNNQVFKKGGKMIITAGVGCFSKKAQPDITIAGKTIPVNSEGVAEHSFRVPVRPGKYSTTVKIVFTKEDGTKSSIEKQVEYIVEKDCEDLKMQNNDKKVQVSDTTKAQ